jgi:hypothetical protein
MSLVDIIKEALHLKSEERYIIENLIKSLNVPDEEIDKIWIEESQKRLTAYKEGAAKTVLYDQVFGKTDRNGIVKKRVKALNSLVTIIPKREV